MPSAVRALTRALSRALTRALSRALPRRRRPPGSRAPTSHRRPLRTKALLPARVVLPATLCLCTVLGAAPGASATPARWSVAPAGGGRPSFYAEGPPGSVLQDTVAVTNPGRAPVVVRLSGSGLRTVFADRAEHGIRVPARTRAEVPFTVTVPAGAAPGDRSGAVVARDTRGRTATVPVRLRVGGPALAALTVEHVAVHAEGITYELVNRGTTVLVPRLAVRVDGVLGRVLDRAPRTLPVHLRPGARVKLTEPWPDRPALDAVDVRLTVTAPGGAHDTATTSARFVPWPAVAGGALLAGAIAVLTVRRRRHPRPSHRPAPEDSAPDIPTPGAPASDAPAARSSSSGPLPTGTSASTPAPLDGRALEGSVPGSVTASVPTADVAAPGGPVAGGLSSGPLPAGTSASTAPPVDGQGLEGSVPGSVTAGVPTAGVAAPGVAAPGGPAARGLSAGPLPTGTSASIAPHRDGPAPEGRTTRPLVPGGPAPGPASGGPRWPGWVEAAGGPPTGPAPGGGHGGELTEGAVQ